LNDLIVYGVSSDQSVVANVGIVFGCVGGNRSVLITPVAGGIGKTKITVTVDDGQDTASNTFDVTVTGYPVYLPLVIRSE
jgi:uncharacterized protein YjdB